MTVIFTRLASALAMATALAAAPAAGRPRRRWEYEVGRAPAA